MVTFFVFLLSFHCLFGVVSYFYLLPLASVLTLPKRDLSSADLASPCDLRMDSWSPNEHVSPAPSSLAAASSIDHGLRLPDRFFPPLTIPFSTVDTPRKQQVSLCLEIIPPGIHPMITIPIIFNSTINGYFTPEFFKEVTVGQGASQTRQLMGTETDNASTRRFRRPKFFFHEIFGHVKDRWE
jgi:hypothetical protein